MLLLCGGLLILWKSASYALLLRTDLLSGREVVAVLFILVLLSIYISRRPSLRDKLHRGLKRIWTGGLLVGGEYSGVGGAGEGGRVMEEVGRAEEARSGYISLSGGL